MPPSTNTDDTFSKVDDVSRSKGSSGNRGRGRGRGVDDSAVGAGASSSSAEDSSSSSPSVDDSAKGRGKGRGKDDTKPTPGVETFNVVGATLVPGQTSLYESLATPQRDKLTGLLDNVKVKTTYTWLNLSDSLLKVRGLAGYDIVENFTVSNTEGGSDDLFAPQSITTTSITASNGNISKLVAGQINAKVLNKANFLANSAAAFTCTGFDGLFVAFNDSRDGYQQNSDTLVFLQGYNIASGRLVVN